MVGRRLRPDSEPTPVLEADRRVQALQAVRVEPRSPEEYVREIGRLWGRAQGSFLEIGRLLLRAKENLPHGDYLNAIEAQLPFNRRTAYMLREAARWAISAPFPPEELPGSYATIYTLSTLEPPVLDQAKEEGLIKPTLSRAELDRWRKQKVTVPADQRTALEQRIARLNRERARIEEDLRRAEADLAALDGGKRRR